MHKGWRRLTVDEVCERISVGIVIQPAQYYVSRNDGVRAFRSANVGENRIVDRDWVYLSHDGNKANSKSILTAGDVLVVRSGAPGTACVVTEEYAGSNCIDIVFARPNKNIVLSAYLAEFTNSPVGKRHVLGMQGGLALKHFNVGAYKKLEILLPPIHEQRQIVEILSAWDICIEKLTDLLEAKRQRFTWFRTHLLSGRQRLSEYCREWSEVPLAAVLKEHGLRSTGDEEVFSVSVHKGLVNQIEHLGRSFAAQQTRHYNRVLPGDIVYTKSPTGDFPLGIIKQSRITDEVIVSPLYGVFTPATIELGVIIDAYFESPVTIKNYLRPLVQKGAKNTIAITNKRFLEGKLRLPLDPEEQKAIAEIIETARAEVALIEAGLEVVELQKRGLMQKLLTGEWRVKVDSDKEAAA